MTAATKGRGFGITDADAELIEKIAKRFAAIVLEQGDPEEWPDVEADAKFALERCHARVCALRLDDLLAADRFNFIHDVDGIGRHINYVSGRGSSAKYELSNCFLPRFAARKVRS